MLNIKNKNIPKRSINQALSYDSYNKFLYTELLPRLNERRIYSKSQETIAKILGVSISTVERIFLRLKEEPGFYVGDPVRRNNSKYFFTIKISLFKKYKTCLLEYEGERNNINKNILKKVNIINTPISPKGNNGVYRHEEKDKKQDRRELILRLGRKYRWHFAQTLTLFAYPTHIILQASEELSSAIEEANACRNPIRSSFRYLRKIIQNFMRDKGLKPLWKLYYKEKAFFAAQPKRVTLPPVPRAPSPQPVRPLRREDFQNALTKIKDLKLRNILEEMYSKFKFA